MSVSQLNNELQSEWEKCATSDGFVYFLNKKSKKAQWVHPLTGLACNVTIEDLNKTVSNNTSTKTVSCIKKAEAVIAGIKRRKKLSKARKRLMVKLVLNKIKNVQKDGTFTKWNLSSPNAVLKCKQDDVKYSVNMLEPSSKSTFLQPTCGFGGKASNMETTKPIKIFQAVVLPSETGNSICEKNAGLLKRELIDKLEKAVLKRNGEPSGLLLRFKNVRLIKPGWLLVTCQDKETLDWVLEWKPLTNKEYRVVRAVEAPWPVKINFTLNSDENLPSERALKLLTAQNRHLSFEDWCFLSLERNSGSWVFHFMTSNDVGKQFDTSTLEIFYELSTIPVNIFTKLPTMVINYARKSDRATKYSQEGLPKAVEEVKSGSRFVDRVNVRSGCKSTTMSILIAFTSECREGSNCFCLLTIPVV